MRTFSKNERLIISSALLLPVPVLALPNLLPGRFGLEPRLNVLWALLAMGALAHWWYRRCRSHFHFPELVGLIFILSLLFPVISANDDLLRQQATDESSMSQYLAAGLETEKHLAVAASSRSFSPALVAPQFSPVLLGFEFVAEIFPVPHDAPAIRASGNHSPPFC